MVRELQYVPTDKELFVVQMDFFSTKEKTIAIAVAEVSRIESFDSQLQICRTLIVYKTTAAIGLVRLSFEMFLSIFNLRVTAQQFVICFLLFAINYEVIVFLASASV